MIRSQVEVSLESQDREHEVEHDYEPLLFFIIQKGENINDDDFLYQTLHVRFRVSFWRSICRWVEVLVESQSDKEADHDIEDRANYGNRCMYNVDTWPALKFLFK